MLESVETSIPMISVMISAGPGSASVASVAGPVTADPGLDTPGLSTDTLLEEETRLTWSDGDHDRFAHYVRKEKILESALSGEPVIALCGKVWVPGRDPSRFPVCPQCKAIYEGLPQSEEPDAKS